MAKIYADKLADTLKRQAASLFIVSGDDPLLVQESCDLVRANLKERGYIERELFHVEGSFDWSSLLYSTNSMSLFADKKLLEVRMPSGKPGDQGSKALQEILEQLGDETAMLLVLPRVDQQAQRTKWFKALEAKGLLVQVWPIDAKDLPRWLNGRFRQAGLRVTSEAVQVMAQRIEGNLLAAVQEIERLKLTAPDGQCRQRTIRCLQTYRCSVNGKRNALCADGNRIKIRGRGNHVRYQYAGKRNQIP
jgi:DNA polymerase-3 subunit delta